jgi:squalene cyclase
MRIRAFVTAAALLAGLTSITGCAQSYEELTEGCLTALKARTDGDKGKPEACEDVKSDDYAALVMSVAVDDLGWSDENGDFDANKMLDDLTDGN